MFGIKAFLALAILVILVVQLLGVVEDAAGYYHRWLNRSNPHGNPMKVFMEIDQPVLEGDDHILKKIKKDLQAPRSGN